MTDGWPVCAQMRRTSPDGKRVYVVRTSLPPGPCPASGHPVLCMLDGDWTRPALTAADAARLPAIIVSIGYGDDKTQSKAARAFDYTPQILPGRTEFDPRVPSWQTGGADAFLDFLEARLLPEALAGLAADTSRMTLFGHSYGGLCALYGLMTRAQVFQRYAVASPSLWWGDGFMQKTALAADRPTHAGPLRELLVMAGEQERWHAHPAGADGSPASRTGGTPTLPAMRELVQTLNTHGIAKAELAVFPDMGHGDMLRASVHRALLFCVQGPD